MVYRLRVPFGPSYRIVLAHLDPVTLSQTERDDRLLYLQTH